MNGWVSQQWNGHLKCKLEPKYGCNLFNALWCFWNEMDGFSMGFKRNVKTKAKWSETKTKSLWAKLQNAQFILHESNATLRTKQTIGSWDSHEHNSTVMIVFLSFVRLMTAINKTDYAWPLVICVCVVVAPFSRSLRETKAGLQQQQQ